MNAVDTPGTAAGPLLVVDGLTVSFARGGPARPVVRDVSLTVDRGECLAVVGESGSGKSVTARALVGLVGDRSLVRARRLSFDGTDLSRLTERQWRSVRGRRIGLVLQDALVSLDPLHTVGAEISEALRAHRGTGARGARPLVASLLTDVGVPDPELRAGQYPHQLSGGLRQRALIASSLAGRPELLIADEPTTALDVTVQAQVLSLLGRLVEDGTALLLISHDLAVVARLANRVAVMYGGTVVEQGSAEAVLRAPRHPYTRALLAAVPTASSKGSPLSVPMPDLPAAGPDGCAYAFRCPRADERCRQRLPEPDGTSTGERHSVLCWHPVVPDDAPAPPPAGAVRPRATPAASAAAAPAGTDPVLLEVEGVVRRFRGPDGRLRDAVRDVSFRLDAGEVLGVVGESGSGKTTTARIVLGLEQPDAGSVRFEGRPWSGIPERLRRSRRKRIQVVHQDPLGSFDPRYTVRRLVEEAVARSRDPRDRARRRRVEELLDLVGLSRSLWEGRPAQLSGGQRQRVAMARALATRPRLLVCDEPVSALDVTIQAQVLDLLVELRRELGIALMFISHDLGVVHHVSDRVLVMKDAGVVEEGEVGRVFGAPAHPYTRGLVAALPRPHRPSDAVPLGAPEPGGLHG